MKTKIVILGAGYAGILCANRLEKQNQNVEIFIVSDSILFQERIRFHEYAAHTKEKKIPIPNLLRKNIHFVPGKIIKILPHANQVMVETKTGVNHFEYDFLVVSIGSSGIRNHSEDENSIQSRDALDQFLANQKSKPLHHVCILGGGLTGIELASEWKEKFPNTNVTLVDQNIFGNRFSKPGKNHLEKKFKSLGIRIIETIEIKKIVSGKLIFKNNTELLFDSLLNCTGFLINPLLRESGFLTNDRNQIYVDPFLRSKEYQNIFVAGDAAKLEHSTLRMGCVTALPMGAYVADTITNTLKKKTLSPFSFQFFGRCVSLGRNDGLIQWTYGDDSPKERVITGKLAALIKETVNRFTIFSLKMEKRVPFRFYFWPKGNLFESKDFGLGNRKETRRVVN
ncbi:NADH dehydrogenase [Leptospira biflexa serovar Patoc strain 'Patoc 1 (Ames)']|uniref:Putative NAD(FAD)-dependent dehydrogenase n=1 Tax=Leptospira biflexa serovar Patoc (strain Patoc 1 / ATCC 23582 / Paris) TaxID=456481 RepID=B0SN07_LEPBP|nr:FAD-dependent oxidoreductase [Leptospira biflexa]ABZ93562.1 NADH dehydrogenase [Leptospira biflexa serovar Patoc strain 'Patoc 1 (Ames)']ABZ97194.1 Putative NAD(FAD)-dependent dehydrogenase [Leptospira biflexa serovar Patoc strain 'Patoc 1 (Paris)']